MSGRFLLDTHAFLWWANASPNMSRRARSLIQDSTNALLVSHASAWEMAIKASSGKLRLPGSVSEFFPAQLSANGFDAMEIRFAHVALVGTLPFHHRDPFDRLVIAQALTEKVPIISNDAVFERYGVKRLW